MTTFEELQIACKEFIDLPEEAFEGANLQMIKDTIQESFAYDTIKLDYKEIDDFKKNMTEAFLLMEQEFSGDMSPGKREILTFFFDLMKEKCAEILAKAEESIPYVRYELINDKAQIPTYAHEGDIGADIYCPDTITIPAHSWGMIVPTGFKMVLPLGWEAQVRPRSGMSAKTPIRIANAPGTIEYTYRGEVGVIVDNFSNEDYTIHEGDRIAQLVFYPTERLKGKVINSVDDFPTDRGEGGFGSTGR